MTGGPRLSWPAAEVRDAVRLHADDGVEVDDERGDEQDVGAPLQAGRNGDDEVAQRVGEHREPAPAPAALSSDMDLGCTHLFGSSSVHHHWCPSWQN